MLRIFCGLSLKPAWCSSSFPVALKTNKIALHMELIYKVAETIEFLKAVFKSRYCCLEVNL